eukprot:SAG31_NODE_7476_length_1680_cov_1.335231_2_plen_43_part_01
MTGGYSNNLRCAWQIQCDPGQIAMLRVRALDTEPRNDILRITA